MDGNHKLIRWGFVVHGGIDGFSRKIMYLRCNTNNKARTVKELFLSAVLNHGIPSRVRADQGVENVDIARYMLNHPLRGPGRKSFIAGKSCHNQRIERLWRDVFCSSLSKFYCVFWYLEDIGLLDISCEKHLYVLHLVFTARINKDLNQFTLGWDNHQIRSAHNRTPNQLWILGKLTYEPEQENSLSQQLPDEYGVDFNGPVPVDNHTGINTVEIAEFLNDEQKSVLMSRVDILGRSDSFGIDVYINTLQEVESLLSLGVEQI